jgi:DNA polymerase III subunit delta'
MIYDSLIIHTEIWNNLLNVVSSGRLPHALLLHGNDGSGKEAHAIELSALINCNLRSENGACGNCPSCKKIKSFQHGNIKLIFPYPRGKISSSNDPSIRGLTEKNIEKLREMMLEKGNNPYARIEIENARTILINSIREVKKELYMSRIDDGWTVVLIFEAEKLCIPQPNSANALLKVLEEPPEKTIFILVTSEVSAMIDTIRSRCQQIYFPPLSSASIKEVLIKNNVPENKTKVISNIASGNVRLALDLSGNIDDLFSDLKLMIKAFYSSSPTTWQEVINRTSTLKRRSLNELSYFFRTSILYMRDLHLAKYDSSDDNLIFTNLDTHLRKIIIDYPNANWDECIDILENTFENIQRNGYLPLMITTMLIEIKQQILGKKLKPFSIHDWVL